MTESAFALQPEKFQKRFAKIHHNSFTGKDASLAWYLSHRFCMHPDWVDGPTRDGSDVKERMRSTAFVYGGINGKYFPPVAYTDPDKDSKGPRPKTYHYFTYKMEDLNREFARSGAHWYFKRITAALRENRDVDAAEYLGAFLHAIQDRVSPYHVWDGYTEKRETFETTYSEAGLQSPEGSRGERKKNTSLFWGLGGEGMDNTLPSNFKPQALGTARDAAVEAFVERLFQSRVSAEKVYTEKEGFMKSHLSDDWKNRKTSETTKQKMAKAAADNVKLCADVMLTAWKLANE